MNVRDSILKGFFKMLIVVRYNVYEKMTVSSIAPSDCTMLAVNTPSTFSSK